VAKDNTVAIGDRSWQIGKTRFRSSLAGSTVTIHEHLDETVSIRFGPHVVGRFDRAGEKLGPVTGSEHRGKGGSMVSVRPSTPSRAGRVFDGVVAWTNNDNGEGAGEAARRPTE
jgi:hypothetical protein